jgi:Fe-S cluster assembly iron-binding protein IscA
MFNITDEAQIYVADLFAQQDEEGLGLKVDIEKAGTPAAAVTFNFCYEKDLGKTYFKFEYKGFDAFIDEANFDYLKDSEVALKEEGSSKKPKTHIIKTLTITKLCTNPGVIQGTTMPLIRAIRIRHNYAQANTYIIYHFGFR